MNPTRNDLSSKVRASMVALLNDSLADAVDLWTQAKQAHWNVKGPAFIAIHELFDKVAAAAETFADDIAERAVALGGVAMGTATMASKHSRLDRFPERLPGQEDFLAAVAEALATFGRHVRRAIDTAGDGGDQGTADLFTGISRECDKLLWFVEAHTKR